MIAGVMMLGALLGGHADTIPPQRVDGKIDWVYTYAEGQRLARASAKPMFVVFRCER
jgi:hypothetical protein